MRYLSITLPALSVSATAACVRGAGVCSRNAALLRVAASSLRNSLRIASSQSMQTRRLSRSVSGRFSSSSHSSLRRRHAICSAEVMSLSLRYADHAGSAAARTAKQDTDFLADDSGERHCRCSAMPRAARSSLTPHSHRRCSLAWSYCLRSTLWKCSMSHTCSNSPVEFVAACVGKDTCMTTPHSKKRIAPRRLRGVLFGCLGTPRPGTASARRAVRRFSGLRITTRWKESGHGTSLAAEALRDGTGRCSTLHIRRPAVRQRKGPASAMRNA